MTHHARRPRMAVFLGWQAVILGAGAALAAFRVAEIRRQTQWPPLRDRPLAVEPLYDYAVIVTDEQLDRVLRKLVPRDVGDKTRINHVDHALRFWGVEAKFNEAHAFSGEAMQRLLVDHRAFAQRFGPKTPSLLIDAGHGVRVRVGEGPASSSHVDHTLAVLAEVGAPCDLPIYAPAGRTTYRAMLEQSLRDFSLNQAEYEWSALTYALFLPTHRSWVTSEHQRVDFNRIAARLMREPMPQGVCFGQHRLHTLVVLLRIDERISILAPRRRDEVLEFLRQMTSLLARHQHSDGFWNQDWPHAAPPDSKPSDKEGDRLADRFIVTGHALEWWALAPSDVHPPRPVLASAGQWLVRSIDELTPDDVQELYPYLSHAGRALALWRSYNPSAFDVTASGAKVRARKRLT